MILACAISISALLGTASAIQGTAGRSTRSQDSRVAVADLVWAKAISAEVIQVVKCVKQGGTMSGQFGFGLRVQLTNKSDREIDLADLPRIGVQLNRQQPYQTGLLWQGVDYSNFATKGKCYVPDPQTGKLNLVDSSSEALYYLVFDRRANPVYSTTDRPGGPVRTVGAFKFRAPVKGEVVIPAGGRGVVLYFVDTLPEMGPDAGVLGWFWIHPALSGRDLPPPGVDWDRRLEIPVKRD